MAVSYEPAIAYDAIPICRGKKILEDYHIKIWNATYINTAKASAQTKLSHP
jgi:hypothetical protein